MIAFAQQATHGGVDPFVCATKTENIFGRKRLVSLSNRVAYLWTTWHFGVTQPQIFERLFRLYYSRLGSFIRRIVGQPQAIEEIVNDTMLTIWRSADRYEGKSKVDTWVFGIAYNKAMEHIRRHQRQTRNEVTLDESDPSFPTIDRNDDAGQWVQQALRRLSPEQRALVELTYTFGYSYPEIAKIVECPPGTVKTRMFHARKLLKPVLERLAEPRAMEQAQ